MKGVKMVSVNPSGSEPVRGNNGQQDNASEVEKKDSNSSIWSEYDTDNDGLFTKEDKLYGRICEVKYNGFNWGKSINRKESMSEESYATLTRAIMQKVDDLIGKPMEEVFTTLQSLYRQMLDASHQRMFASPYQNDDDALYDTAAKSGKYSDADYSEAIKDWEHEKGNNITE